jgi:ABC-type transport system substrate-binding protein
MISRPLTRRSLLRGTAGVGAAALLRPHGIAAARQDVPADAAATQELRIAAATNFLRLDPHLSYHVYSIGVFTYQMWAGLTKMDENLNVVPDIATSWEVSDDGTVYTFHLDPERKFSDGSPITAQDVVWSWTRSLDPATESLVAGGYLEDVVDAQNFWQGEIPNPPSSYQAVDDYTFQVELI